MQLYVWLNQAKVLLKCTHTFLKNVLCEERVTFNRQNLLCSSWNQNKFEEIISSSSWERDGSENQHADLRKVVIEAVSKVHQWHKQKLTSTGLLTLLFMKRLLMVLGLETAAFLAFFFEPAPLAPAFPANTKKSIYTPKLSIVQLPLSKKYIKLMSDAVLVHLFCFPLCHHPNRHRRFLARPPHILFHLGEEKCNKTSSSHMYSCSE